MLMWPYYDRYVVG